MIGAVGLVVTLVWLYCDDAGLCRVFIRHMISVNLNSNQITPVEEETFKSILKSSRMQLHILSQSNNSLNKIVQNGVPRGGKSCHALYNLRRNNL